MSRLIFVGIHNKPGMFPLDSTTKTGRSIDIIQRLIGKYIHRTNLYNVQYLPKTFGQKLILLEEWIRKTKPTENDIIVLLGKEVQQTLRGRLLQCQFIEVAHPASIRGNVAENDYTTAVAFKIINHKKWKTLTSNKK